MNESTHEGKSADHEKIQHAPPLPGNQDTLDRGRIISGNLNQIARCLNKYGAPYNALSNELRAAIAELATKGGSPRKRKFIFCSAEP